VDGMTIGTPIAALVDRDAMIAIGMNGEPLPIAHGFPARMVVPGLYGYVSATKWLVDMEVTRFADFDAYWTERGFDAEAPIKTFSRIDVPKAFAQLDAGKNAIAGVAWAQATGIDKVEVSIDGGDWQQTKLAEVFAPVDDAFAQLPAKTVKALSKPANADMLSSILTYHVVPGQLAPDAVVGEQTSLQGGMVDVTGEGDNLKVNDANVICGGVKTANATVYLIDGVLSPPAA